MSEQFKNFATTTLSSDISAGSTSFDVTDGSVFPATGNFQLVISSTSKYEAITCTARSSNTLTVVRGRQNTSAVSHTAVGSTISLVPTPLGLGEFYRQEVPFFQDHLWVGNLSDYDGNILTSSDFTWVNQGTSTVTDNDDGSITLQATGNVVADQLRLLVKDVPSGEPWKVTAATIPTLHHSGSSTNLTGMGIRDSTSGEFWCVWQAFQSGSTVRDRHVASYFTDANAGFDSNFSDLEFPRGVDLQLYQIQYDVNDDVTLRTNAGGYAWRDVTTQNAVTDGHTFDQVFFFANAGNNGTSSNNRTVWSTLVGWSEEDA